MKLSKASPTSVWGILESSCVVIRRHKRDFTHHSATNQTTRHHGERWPHHNTASQILSRKACEPYVYIDQQSYNFTRHTGTVNKEFALK